MTTTEPPAAEAAIAGAPISWGVCEVPGWGYQLPPDRVLTEMREIGLAATELGPEGFLPTAPEAMAERSREVEEKLSDALHERLTQRFVDRFARRLRSGMVEMNGQSRGAGSAFGGVKMSGRARASS